MIEARFYEKNNIPCLGLKVQGGGMTWQDWMCDSIVLLAENNSNNIVNFNVVSFQTGAILDIFEGTQEILEKLNSSPNFILSSDDFGDDNFHESLLIKSEKIDSTGNFLYGMKFQTQGRISEALSCYDTAAKLIDGPTRIYNLIGLCYRLKNDIENAEKAYLKAIELCPHHSEAYCNLGILYERKQDSQNSTAYFKKALEKDQFYLNALIQFSKLLTKNQKFDLPALATVNLILQTVYSDLPVVTTTLNNTAKAMGKSLPEYLEEIRQDNAFISDSKIMLLLKRTENLRINGAYFACLQGFDLILAKTAQTMSKNFIFQWIAKRIEIIKTLLPKEIANIWDSSLNKLTVKYPDFREFMTKPTQKQSYSPLTPREFFAQALLEVMRDGQIQENEANFIGQLRKLLKINEETYQKIMQSVTITIQANPMSDRTGGAFNPQRLFKNLARAALRDGKVEEEEKKILMFAGKAFGFTSEQASQLIAEVRK